MSDRLRLDAPPEAAADAPVTADPAPLPAGTGRLTRRRLLQACGVLAGYLALPPADRPRSTLRGLGYGALGTQALGS